MAAGDRYQFTTSEVTPIIPKQQISPLVYASYQTVVYGLAKATGSEKLLAGEPGGVFRRQKDSDGGDVARLADAAERSLGDGGLLEIRSDYAATVGAFSLDHARIDGVDPDLLRAEFSGEHASDGVNRALVPV